VRSRLGKHQFGDTKEGVIDRSPLDLPYPKIEQAKKKLHHTASDMNAGESHPESQVYWLAIDHHVCRVVVEDCRNILAGESICGVTDEETCLTHSSGRGRRKRKEIRIIVITKA
jgi:hypothetical protein